MLKKVIACVTSIALVASSIVFYPATKQTVEAVVADPTASGWELVWSDEFNGNSLDTSVWTRETGGSDGGGWGNNELQYYTDRTDNSYVSDGTLKLVARRENYGGCRFTSARLKTAGKKSFRYGKMEARIRVEGGNQDGVWPAFWMMGDDGTGWPYCGELDIMEHANGRNYVEGTIHWGENGTYDHVFWGSYVGANYYFFSDNVNNGITGWHTYGVTWDDSTIKWYVDNNVYLTAYLGSNNAYAFQKAHYFLLNLALGSNSTPYTGGVAPNDSFQSATMYVDYVRAYSYNGSGGSGNVGGPSIPEGYTNCNNGNWVDVGAWQYFVGDGAAAYKGGNSLNDFSMYVQSKAGWDWGIQAKPKVTLEPNTTYNYNITANSSKATGALVVNRDVNGNGVGSIINQGIIAGTNTYSGTFTTGDASEDLVFDLANIDSDTTFSITNLSLTKQVVETQAPSDGYTAVGEGITVGDWYLYAANGSWTEGSMSYKGTGRNMDLSVRVDKSSGSAGSWGLQMKYPVTGLDPNKTYDVKIRYNSTASGVILAKVEEGGTENGTQADVATVPGENTYTRTVSGSDQYQLVLELSGMPAGAVLDMKEVSFTPRADETTQAQETTKEEEPTVPTVGEWVRIKDDGGQDTDYYYDNSTTATIVNIQSPGFTTERGIYANVPTGISGATLNGVAIDSQNIQGAGLIIPLSEINPGENTVVINYAGGTATIKIKYEKAAEPETTTEEPTTKEVTTEETTTEEPTTKEVTTKEPTTVDPKTLVSVQGYQISTKNEGYRVVCAVEPEINGKKVVSYGIVYSIRNLYGTIPTTVTDEDMVVDSKDPYVASYQANGDAVLSGKYGDSSTATYFAQTMTFGKKNTKAFNTVYGTRAYALLEDGNYVYSDVKTASVFAIAQTLYDRQMMTSYESHNYLYEQILKVVDPSYPEVDFNWGGTKVDPGAL